MENAVLVLPKLTGLSVYKNVHLMEQVQWGRLRCGGTCCTLMARGHNRSALAEVAWHELRIGGKAAGRSSRYKTPGGSEAGCQ